MMQYLIRVLQVSAVGATGFYSVVLLNYSFELMQQFALLIVPVIGLWVAGWLFLSLALQRSENVIVSGVGEMLGNVFVYTAFFQGILYTVLVFMMIDYLQPDVDLPPTRTAFIHDFLFGAGYLAAMIFAATGATVLFTRYRWRTRILALLLGGTGTAIPLMALLTGWLSDAVESNMMATLVGSVLFALVMSILLMLLFTQFEDPNYQRKAELKRRLRQK